MRRRLAVVGVAVGAVVGVFALVVKARIQAFS
jgi:hypothetical protein